jgi:hypothetical protein
MKQENRMQHQTFSNTNIKKTNSVTEESLTRIVSVLYLHKVYKFEQVFTDLV